MFGKVLRVREVLPHPEREDLNVIRFDDVQVVTQKAGEDGALRPRYAVDELVVFVADGCVMPDDVIRGHYWNDALGIGGLRGAKGNRVKAGNFAKVRSDGIHFATTPDGEGGAVVERPDGPGEKTLRVREGDDVTAFLGITPWEG